MSSALQSAPTTIQQNDYMTLAILTAIGYDYILTFSDEVEYIWNESWTRVSTLFILIRYFGLYSVIISALEGSSILLGSAKTYFQGEIIYIMNIWTFPLFVGAADLAMILRVWAIYHRSRLVLSTLLAPFSLLIVSNILAAAIDDNPRNQSVSDQRKVATGQRLDFSICGVKHISRTWTKLATILQITEGAAMLILVIFQFVRQSFQMYSVTKQWQINRYMNFLVKQGVLYFFTIFMFALINVLAASGKLPAGGWQVIPLFILEDVPMYTLAPRFIMSIRRLHALDVQSRRGDGIDTAFGLSLSDRGVGGTMVVLTNVEQNERLEGVEEIPMDAGTTQQE